MSDLSELLRSKSLKTVVTLAIIGIVGIILLFNTAFDPDMKVESGNLVIKGMYGMTLPISDIKELSLKDDAPLVLNKLNGIGFGNIMKGKFSVSELGKGKLFLHLNSSPFIYILYDDTYVIISFKDAAKTKALYDDLASVKVN